jgi:hypothetical protein
VRCASGEDAIDALVSDGAQLTAWSGGAPVFSLVWPAAADNPLAPGRGVVQYAAAADGSAGRCGEVAAALRRGAADAAGGASAAPPPPSCVSVVNMQERPLFVFAALRGSDNAPTRPLSPWADVPPSEQPVALSDGGHNCLLLAPLEGTPQCTEDGAEREPFGESNTFRYVAQSGAPMPRGEAALRIEAAFARPAGGLLGGAYADDDEEAEPGLPFASLALPLPRTT